ncbi:DUF4390 domain-containing protein [Ramlibacter sp. AW1]|uniref:DUF4390 domain-containing protein n=2 Tax=Ramlibacter aurantiacus TaxID=2801330 RepID=A0A936ZS20_9BURK|nr:DUF4390 domain-containing protein [Ramlibacter aurantiacus]
MLLFVSCARAEPTEIAWMRVDRDDGLRLSAQVRFQLAPVIEDALSKGIPMVFVAEALVLRDRWYWYDKEVATATRYMRLTHQPLTRRWRLQVSSSALVGQGGAALGQTFDTQEEALAAVQRISSWRIASEDEIEPDGRHYVTLRFRLDVSQLPRPFQIGVVGQPEWSIAASRTVRVGPEGAR